MADRLPSLSDIDAVLAHIPAIERSVSRPASWFRAPPEVLRLQEALAQHGFVIPFDAAAWREQVEHYQRDHAALADASLADLCKLLTFHVRADRFINGQFASMVQSGLIPAILRRLKVIRDGGAPPEGGAP